MPVTFARIAAVAAACALAGAAPVAVAASPAPAAAIAASQITSPALRALTRIVQGSSHDPNLRVVRTFPGPAGFTGIVLSRTGQADTVIWITDDHKELVLGAMYTADGKDLTRAAMYSEAILEQPSAAIAAAAAPAAHGILAGTHGPRLTFFLDPNCIFCHELYDELQPYVDTGKVQVRYVLVGVIKPTSAARAAAILAAPDPASALAEDEAAFDVKHEEGGYPSGKVAAAKPTATVAANNALMQRTGSTGTPTVLYCDGGKVKMQVGAPQHLGDWLHNVDTDGAAECR